MKKNNSIMCVFCLLLILSVQAFGQSNELRNDLARLFKRVSVVNLNPADELNKARLGQTLTLSFDNLNLRIHLIANDLRSEELQKENPRAATNFRGEVIGREDSIVRFNLDGKRIEGLVKINDEIFFIQPAKDGSNFAAANEFIVYQSNDRLQNTTFHCPLDASVSNANKMVENQMPKTKFPVFSDKPFFMTASFAPPVRTRNSAMFAAPFNPLRRVQIAVAADLEWYTIEGQGDYTQAVAKIDN